VKVDRGEDEASGDAPDHVATMECSKKEIRREKDWFSLVATAEESELTVEENRCQ